VDITNPYIKKYTYIYYFFRERKRRGKKDLEKGSLERERGRLERE